MNRLVSAPARPTPAAVPGLPPDYYARAQALWPRLESHRLARVKHDPGRVAALVARRTTLSYAAILQLLGVPPAELDAANRDH